MTSPWTVECEVVGNAVLDVLAFAGIASMHLFDAGALAVGEEHAEERVRLTAGFDSEQSAELAAGLVARKMPEATCVVIADARYQEWIATQQASLEPTTIGAWTIRAPWHHMSADVDRSTALHDVVIDPGAAFGHGAHQTTRLAIEFMLATLERPGFETARVVDLGTGTGVVAIVAALVGHRVQATEHDPVAVQVALDNIAANNVADAITLTCGDAGETPIEADDLVIANVTIDVHRIIAQNYAIADTIIASGILSNQVAEMCALLPYHRPATIRTHGEWAGIFFERAPHTPHDQRITTDKTSNE